LDKQKIFIDQNNQSNFDDDVQNLTYEYHGIISPEAIINIEKYD
jgi:hypothetical protein